MVAKLHTAVALALGTLSLVTTLEAQASDPATATESDRPDTPETQDHQTNKGARATELSEVVVTGSRLVTNGAAAPSPTTVMSAEELQNRAPTDIADALNQLPQFSGSNSNSRTTGFVPSTAVAGNYLNLRNLGTDRLLILFDGVRVPATSQIASNETSGGVDVNVLPQALVERVDVVTGGASAAYGSQAVSGVVNYVLDKNFNGVKASVQGGLSGYRDAESKKFTLAAGTSLLDGRMHVEGSAEYFYIAGLLNEDRPLGKLHYGTAGTGLSPSSPLTTYPDVNIPFFNGNGIIIGGPLSFQQFGPGGVPVPFDPGASTGTLGANIGGDGSAAVGASATASLRTEQVFGRVSFELTPDVNIYAQGIWSSSKNVSYAGCCDARIPFGPLSATIFSGNAFLNPAVQSLLTATNTPAFQVGRYILEEPPGPTNGNPKYGNVKVGGDGSLGSSWRWDAAFNYGKAVDTVSRREADTARFAAALDAVTAPDGQIVCRVALTNPGVWPGCVPLNLMGPNTVTPQMINYFTGISSFEIVNTTQIYNANLRGKVLDLWAGPLSVAVGGEYRKEQLEQTSDSDPNFATTGIRGVPAGALEFSQTNVGPARGVVKVKEGYVESLLPLAKDAAWAKSADLNAAARVTDYNTSGTVETWKVGLSYQPVNDLRLRGMVSRDIAAPSLFNLFSGAQSDFQIVLDPHTNIANGITTQTVGNPNLKPEKATTYTTGFVYSPSPVPGLTVSLDYYHIEIKDAILSTVPPGTALQECEVTQGASPLCADIVRPLPFSDHSAANFPTAYIDKPLNLSTIRQSGIDLETGYITPLSQFVSSWPGELAIRALGTYLTKFEQQNTPASPVVDYRGMKQNPTLRATVTVDYHTGPATIGMTAYGFNSWQLDRRLIYANYGTQPGVVYLNFRGAYAINSSGNVELFVNVDNALNKMPSPMAVTIPGFQFPVSSLYDVTGRYFTAGIRMKL
jgi:iron complex outermembrane recepter protein